MSDREGVFLRWELPSFDQAEPAPEAQVDLAQEQAQAREAGLAQGLAEGRAQGLAEAKLIVDRLALLLDGMAAPYKDLDQIITQELVKTSMHIARQVIRRELSLDSTLVATAVSEAMATLSTLEDEVEIYLNPADSEHIRQLAPELIEARCWKIVEDSEILPGGCRLKTPVSYVDASVEHQLDMMLSGLLDACEAQPET